MFTKNKKEEKKQEAAQGQEAAPACPHCRVSKDTIEILKKQAEEKNKK